MTKVCIKHFDDHKDIKRSDTFKRRNGGPYIIVSLDTRQDVVTDSYDLLNSITVKIWKMNRN